MGTPFDIDWTKEPEKPEAGLCAVPDCPQNPLGEGVNVCYDHAVSGPDGQPTDPHFIPKSRKFALAYGAEPRNDAERQLKIDTIRDRITEAAQTRLKPGDPFRDAQGKVIGEVIAVVQDEVQVSVGPHFVDPSRIVVPNPFNNPSLRASVSLLEKQMERTRAYLKESARDRVKAFGLPLRWLEKTLTALLAAEPGRPVVLELPVGVPDGAKILAVETDHVWRGLRLIVQHPSFPAVRPGEMLPTEPPGYSTRHITVNVYREGYDAGDDADAGGGVPGSRMELARVGATEPVPGVSVVEGTREEVRGGEPGVSAQAREMGRDLPDGRAGV